VIPKIEHLRDYSEVLQIAPSDSLRLILWEREEVGLKEALERLKEKARIFFIAICAACCCAVFLLGPLPLP
jgi:hypothetical protein